MGRRHPRASGFAHDRQRRQTPDEIRRPALCRAGAVPDGNAPARPSRPSAREFETHRFGATYDEGEFAEGNVEHFRAVVEKAVDWQAQIDQLTDRALVAKWPIDRIDPVLRALFRAAGAEITQMDTPPKVAITEYVDVAKAFFPDGKEPKFVNAVLDHMAHEARPDGVLMRPRDMDASKGAVTCAASDPRRPSLFFAPLPA